MQYKTMKLLCVAALVAIPTFASAAPFVTNAYGPLGAGNDWGASGGPGGPNTLRVTAEATGQVVATGDRGRATPAVPGTGPYGYLKLIIDYTVDDQPHPLHIINGPFTGVAPNQDPYTLVVNRTPTALAVDSESNPAQAVAIVRATPGNTLLAVENLNLDLLGGPNNIDVRLADVVFDVYLGSAQGDGDENPDGTLSINAAVRIKELKFHQTGPGTSDASGNYSIQGKIVGLFDAVLRLENSIDLTTLADQELSEDVTLTGTATTTHLTAGPYPNTVPGGDIRLALDGALGLEVPITLNSMLETNLGFAAAAIHADLAASLTLDLAYHIEGIVNGVAIEVVPEPGTFVLLGIGLVGLIPVVRRRLRK